MNKRTISAIISVYNSEEFIRGRLENLLNQTIIDKLEIIIINSNSQEGEEKIIEEYLQNKNIKYLHTETTETIYKAWNRGIKLSSGKYITNANTDDRLKNNALEILIDILEKNNEIALVYSDQYISDVPNQEFLEIKNKKHRFNRPKYSRIKLLSEYIAGSQAVWRASLHFKDNIWFEENFEVGGDYDFVCKITEKYKIKRVEGVLGVYYKSADKLNKELKNINLTLDETFAIQDKYARRYILSLSNEELKQFEKKINRIIKIPKFIYSLVRIIMDRFFPSRQIPPLVFFIWLSSIIKESKGNKQDAIKLCKKYINDKRANLIHQQYYRLTKINLIKQ